MNDFLSVQEFHLSWEINERTYTASITPRTYKAQTLITEFAEAWKRYHLSGGTSYRAALSSVTAIRSLAKFLDEPGDRFLTLEGDEPRIIQRFIAWERHLISGVSPTSHTPRRHSLTLKRLAAYFLSLRDIQGTRVENWSQTPALQYYESDQRFPLDEFSNAERIAIENTCRKIVRSSESLLRVGSELVDIGDDPRTHGWNKLPNLLWGLRNLPMSELPQQTPPIARSKRAWDVLAEYFPETEKWRLEVPGNPVFSLLVPSLLTLTAFRILIHMRTDLVPEETLGLSRNDVEISNTYVRLKTVKNRANRVRYRTLDRSQSMNEGWKPGDLIVRAENAMKVSRNIAPESNSFWVGSMQKFNRHRSSREGIYPSWVTPLSGGAKYNLSAIISFTELNISKPYDLRRCRKTAKSAMAVLLGTLNGGAGGDHSIEVFRNHYAQSTTVHTIAAHTVLNAQKKVIGKVGPTFIPYESSVVALSQNDDSLTMVARDMSKETALDKELALTGCRNPMSPPFSLHEELCMEAPNYCLACSNAIIFKDHLPRLLEYKKHLKALADEISPLQFQAQFGQQLKNLESILSQFSPAEKVEAGETQVEIRRPLVKGTRN